MAVRSNIGSSGRGPNSVVQNLDQKHFSGNMENTRLMTASILLDLNIDQDKKYKPLDVENFECGKDQFPSIET